jgi:hypothetical protein
VLGLQNITGLWGHRVGTEEWDRWAQKLSRVGIVAVCGEAVPRSKICLEVKSKCYSDSVFWPKTL